MMIIQKVEHNQRCLIIFVFYNCNKPQYNYTHIFLLDAEMDDILEEAGVKTVSVYVFQICHKN